MSENQKTYLRPLPDMETEEKPFWASLKKHAMEIQKCADCGQFCFQPKPLCPNCLSSRLVWTPVSGRGKVYATTNQYHPFLPGYGPEDVPYNISLVELDEGVRLTTKVVGIPCDQVKIGMAVEVNYEDVTDEVTLANFRPVAGA